MAQVVSDVNALSFTSTPSFFLSLFFPSSIARCSGAEVAWMTHVRMVTLATQERSDHHAQLLTLIAE